MYVRTIIWQFYCNTLYCLLLKTMFRPTINLSICVFTCKEICSILFLISPYTDLVHLSATAYSTVVSDNMLTTSLDRLMRLAKLD